MRCDWKFIYKCWWFERYNLQEKGKNGAIMQGVKVTIPYLHVAKGVATVMFNRLHLPQDGIRVINGPRGRQLSDGRKETRVRER